MTPSSKRILIGEITTAHGIKGLVKVRTYAEDESLFDAPLFTDETTSKTISLTLKNMLKGDWLAEVAGITERNGAESLRGTKLYIDRDAMPEAEDGEHYIEDIKGFKIIDGDGKDIGTLLDVVNFGASDLLDIKPADGGSSFYLPFTDNIVKDIDTDNGVIIIDMPDIV